MRFCQGWGGGAATLMQVAGGRVCKTLAALAGLLLLLTGAGSALAQTNYCLNAGFENGTNYPWTYYGGTGGVVTNPKPDANDPTPNVWSNFGNPTYVNVASQNYMTNVYLVPGSTYHIHAQYYIPSSEVVSGTTPRAGILLTLQANGTIWILDPRYPDHNVAPAPNANIPILDEWYTIDYDWVCPNTNSAGVTLTGSQQLNYMGFRWYGGDGTTLATAAHPNPGGYVDNCQFSFGSSQYTNGVNATDGLNGVVVDSSGNPVSGATVTLSSSSNPTIETSITQPNGSYVFAYLAPYGTNLSVSATYGTYSGGPVSLTPSSSADTFPSLTIAGLSFATVSGTVTTSPGGAPIAGAVVTASYTNLPSAASAPSAVNGSYSLRVFVGQQASLSAAASGYTLVSSPAPVTAPNTNAILGNNFTMSLNTYTITASAGANGTIAPGGVTTVNYGGSQSYTITANAGYTIFGVSVDGTAKGSITSYTFTNVVVSHTIAATFGSSAASPGSGTISVNYCISPGSSSLPLSSSSTVGASPAANWNNVSNTGPGGVTAPVQLFNDNSGLSVGPFNVLLSSGSVNTWNIHSASFPDEDMLSTWAMDGGGTATFQNIPYTNSYNLYVYLSSYNHPVCQFTIGSTVVNMNNTNSPSNFPTYGYIFGNNYVAFTNLTGSSQTLTVGAGGGISGFQIVANANSYVVNASAGSNGAITPSGVSVVPAGSNISYTITPNSGFQVQSVTVDGVLQGSLTSYTFNNVVSAHTISVTFISQSIDPHLVVVLDASTLLPGVLTSWPNGGILGGTFNSYTPTEAPTVATVSGRQAVHFVQPDSTAASRQTLACTLPAPASLSGNNPWSISADLYSTNLNYISSENGYFCWAGSYQGVGTCAEFQYLNNGAYNHETMSGVGPYYLTGGFANVPSANAWHNVTITYDGTTQTIYIDGAYDSSAAMSLNLATNNILMVGGRYYQNQRDQDQYWRLANAYIGKLQVFSKALTATQVATMFTPLSYAISGTVTVGGSPAAGVTVTLTGAADYTTTTDGSGNYSVAVLVGSTNSPSPYTVTASGVGYSTSSQNVNVNGAALTGVNFALTLQDNLVGTVKTSGGAPIYNAIVQVGGSNGVFAISALDGTYRVGGIPTNSSVELYAKGLGYGAFINNIDTTGAATGVVTNNIVLTAQVATGVISNGGFEVIDPGSGIPSAWHEWAGYNCPDAGGNYVGGLGDDYISATSASGEVYSGTYAAEYNPNLYTPGGPSGAYTFLWQDVPVMSNSTYNVYWKMKADANVTAHVFCLISFRNSNTITNETDMFSYAGGVTTNWTQYPSASPAGQDAVFAPGQATRFAVPAGANVVNVLLGVDDSYTGPPLYFDDVVVDRNDLVSVPVTYTITATNGVGGVVSPSGAVVVTNGNNQTFTITPSGPAYSRNQVLVDGVNNRGAVTSGSYTFTSVNANHTIGAAFTYNPPTAPGFLPVSIQSGNLVLRTATQVGYNYYLLQTTSLNPPVVWTTNSITAGTGGTITNTPAITSGQPKTFYRYMAQ